VRVRTVTDEDRRRYQLAGVEGGLVITSVADNTDLAERGVTPGDVILAAGGKAVRTPADLESAVDSARRANRPILLQIQGRAGPPRYVAVEVAGRG
jgi:serine protease Do